MYAYTLDADTDSYIAGLSWALNGHVSINLGYERRTSSGAGDFGYDNELIETSLLYGY